MPSTCPKIYDTSHNLHVNNTQIIPVCAVILKPNYWNLGLFGKCVGTVETMSLANHFSSNNRYYTSQTSPAMIPGENGPSQKLVGADHHCGPITKQLTQLFQKKPPTHYSQEPFFLFPLSMQPVLFM